MDSAILTLSGGQMFMSLYGFSSALARATLATTLFLTATGRAGAQTAPVDVVAILPLTGNLAFLGQATEKTLQGVEDNVNATGGINGRSLRFVYLDDATSPVNALQLASQLPKGTAVFFDGGPVATCKATFTLVASGPVEYCLSPVFDPPAGSYGFSASTSAFDAWDATWRYFAAQGWKRIGILSLTDASGQAGEQYVADLDRKYGMTAVAHERFAPADISVSAQITRILEAKPQIIFLASNGSPTTTALRALKDAGNTVPVGTLNGNMVGALLDANKDFIPATFITAAPRWAAPETIGAGPVRDAVRTYMATLKRAGLKPDMGSSLGYDPALIVVQALRALGPSATAQQLRDYIASLHGFAGSNGYYDFRAASARGLTIRDVVVVRYDRAHQTWIGVSGPGGTSIAEAGSK